MDCVETLVRHLRQMDKCVIGHCIFNGIGWIKQCLLERVPRLDYILLYLHHMLVIIRGKKEQGGRFNADPPDETDRI